MSDSKPPSARRRGSWIDALLLGVLFLTTSGCGVTEYENRIGAEQARLEYFDRENQLLEGPMKWPEKKDEKKDDKSPPDVIQPQDVFFRPPKGIITTPQPAGGQVLQMLAVQSAAQPVIQDVRIVVVRGKGREAFRTEVLGYFKLSGPAEEKLLKVPGRKPLTVEPYRHEPTGQYLYLVQDDIYLAAVAFRSTKPDHPALEVSVGTLHFGSEARKQHQAFGQRRAGGK